MEDAVNTMPEELNYSGVSRHYSVAFKIEPSLPLTFRPAIFLLTKL